MKTVADYIRTIPDFPEPGVMFRDITTILQDAEGLHLAVDGLREALRGVDYDLVVGPESRGFIFGVPLAYAAETISETYELEYGHATIEIHKDAIKPGQKVVIVDDLIATGGTTEAMVRLIEKLGGEVVKMLFVIELKGLHGREKLKGYPVFSLVSYEGK